MINQLPYKVTILDTHHQEQFQVANALERYRILRDLQRGEEPVAVFIPQLANEDTAGFVSTLIEVDREQARILIETAQQPELTRIALESPYLLCATQLNKVKVEFRIDHPELIEHAGEQALQALLPTTLVRIQRREYYRLRIPTNITLQCTIHINHCDVRFDLYDISVGGIGGQIVDMDFELAPGSVLEDSQIDIPQVGSVTVDLQVRNELIRSDETGHSLRQIGFSFVDLPEYASNAIQRFIYAREREQK